MSLPAPRSARCPNCGANVEFKLGASRATVCEFCKAVVVRKGQDFEAVGKVADLIPTGSKLSLGVKGKLQSVAFEVIGRLQYEWKAGVWDEWYLAFADGRWGWLAEAQGRFYLTFKVPPRTLPQKGVVAGASFFIEGLGRFTVSDVKQAKIVGVAGELPEPVALDDTPLSADLESEKGAFATLDFGMAGDPPVLFVGRQVPFASLNLGAQSAAPTRGPRPSADKLTCPKCGGNLDLRVPDQAVHVVCSYCKSVLDVSQGAFRVIQTLERFKREPRIPLGSKGKLRGSDFLLVGWMVRSCTVDGLRYPWEEYLLWEESTQAFSWLVESDGHWQLARAISIAEVHVGDDADYRGRRFRHFSSVQGVVEAVLGEFYWAVQSGDRSQLDDYIAPPEGLSCEQSDGEINWTHLDHLERQELATAFGRPGLSQQLQSGVGAIQPWPYEAAWRAMSHWMLGGLGLLLALLFVFALKPSKVYLDQQFGSLQLQSLGSSTAPDGSHTKGFLSQPFELTGDGALQIQFSSDVNQAWAYAGGAVINDVSGESSPFGVESSSYSGYDSDGAWSEGSRGNTQSIPAPGVGKTVVRADLQWDPKLPGPPNMRLRVVSDAFSGWQFVVAFFALLWPVLFIFHRNGFERSRWENSNLGNPYASSSDED